jgi:hypothetical protein
MSTNDKPKDKPAYSGEQRSLPTPLSQQWIDKPEGRSDNRIRNSHESPKNQQREDGGKQEKK